MTAMHYSRSKVALRRPIPLPSSIVTATAKRTWLDWDNDYKIQAGQHLSFSAFGSSSGAGKRQNHAEWFPVSLGKALSKNWHDLLEQAKPTFKIMSNTIKTCDTVLLGSEKGVLMFVVVKLKDVSTSHRNVALSTTKAQSLVPNGLYSLMHAYFILGSEILLNFGISYVLPIRSPEIWQWVEKDGVSVQTMVRLTQMFQMWT